MSSAIGVEQWFPTVGNRPEAELDLFCLPYAGGSTSAFRGWASALDGRAEVLPAQLPGREARITESPRLDTTALADAVAGAVRMRGGRRYAMYGHSMGGRLAFEVIRELRRGALPLPIVLFVGGARPPHLDVPLRRIAGLPDDEFCDRVVAMGGTPPGVLDDPELRALMLPVLRSDFAMVESYTYRPAGPIPVPVVAFAGQHDPEAESGEMTGWSTHTSGPFALHTLPGDHFFCHSARDRLLALIAAHLDAHPPGNAGLVGPDGDQTRAPRARLDEPPGSGRHGARTDG